MKIKINLTEIISQAAEQIHGDENQALFHQWMRFNGGQERLVNVDIPESVIKAEKEKRPNKQYAVRALPENELTRAIGVKWGIGDMPPTNQDVALCYSEQEARRICTILNRFETEHDTKPL